MSYLLAFLVGGVLAALAQVVLDLSGWTAAHVMVFFVVLGGIVAGLGLYEPLIKVAGAGATVPLPGFGAALVKGVIEEVHSLGLVGTFIGSLKATAAGIKAAVIFGLLAAVLFNPRS